MGAGRRRATHGDDRWADGWRVGHRLSKGRRGSNPEQRSFARLIAAREPGFYSPVLRCDALAHAAQSSRAKIFHYLTMVCLIFSKTSRTMEFGLPAINHRIA